MISERLEEKFNYHKTDKRNDMWFHYDILNGIGQDSNVIMELGTRGIVSTWAFLYGLAGTKERLVEVSEDRKKLCLRMAEKRKWYTSFS